jgi:KRAB domain-containing zinc finger protein
LNKHIVEVHELKKPFECNVCQAQFARKEQVKQHISTVHEKLKLFQCSICDHKTSTKGNMKSHTDGMHEGLDIEIIYLGDKNYKCYNCDFKTGLKGDLSKHILEVHHDGKQNWHCDACNKKFARKDQLKQHVLIVHEKLKLFQCSICDYKTGLKGNMKMHTDKVHNRLDVEIIHLGDKKYKCYNCDFKTRVKGDLNKHICKVHDGKQNLHCDICNISFKSEFNLRVHEGQKSHIIKKSKAPAQDFLNESVHERKKEQLTQSLRSVRKVGRNASNTSIEDLSIEEFIENHDPLEVSHVASVHEESSKPKTENGPIVPFLFGGINR